MQSETIALFILTSAVIELTPGPNMAWLAVVALSEGRRPGFAAVAGVALGLLVVGLVAALGLGAAISASPALYALLRWSGVLWLAWLAVEGWITADDDLSDVPPRGSYRRHFRRGLIVNLLNPKAAVFYVAVLPGFVSATPPALPETVTLILIYVAVATVIHGGIVALAGSASADHGSPKKPHCAPGAGPGAWGDRTVVRLVNRAVTSAALTTPCAPSMRR